MERICSAGKRLFSVNVGRLVRPVQSCQLGQSKSLISRGEQTWRDQVQLWFLLRQIALLALEGAKLPCTEPDFEIHFLLMTLVPLYKNEEFG